MRHTRVRTGEMTDNKNVLTARVGFMPDRAYTRIALNTSISVSYEEGNLDVSGTYE